MENTISKFLYVIYFLFFSNEEAKMRIDFAKSLQLWGNRSNIELFLEFTTTVLKSLVM